MDYTARSGWYVGQLAFGDDRGIVVVISFVTKDIPKHRLMLQMAVQKALHNPDTLIAGDHSVAVLKGDSRLCELHSVFELIDRVSIRLLDQAVVLIVAAHY